MTSLELQLKRLKADPSVKNLSKKRDFSSLIFDEKEAQNYTREQFYEIGNLNSYFFLFFKFIKVLMVLHYYVNLIVSLIRMSQNFLKIQN